MKFICAGLPKTGTKSIAHALRILGYQVFDYDDQILNYAEEWSDLFSRGKVPDFCAMFKNVDAVIDFPSNFFFEELMEAFPEAKVILSVRDEDAWARSYKRMAEIAEHSYLTKMGCLLPTYNKLMVIVLNYRMAALGIVQSTSTYICRKRYRWHNERVKSVVPAEKLLVYSVDQGWKPLCEFTETKIPDQPFPRLNVNHAITKTFLTETELGRKVAHELNVVMLLSVVIISVLIVYCFRLL